jgi:ABC-type nitrate/sulfonate/bicarbonate transport system permease component
MEQSLPDALWTSFTQIIIALVLSTTVSLFMGWICTRNEPMARRAEKIFWFLSCLVAVVPTILLTLLSSEIPPLAIAVFTCSFLFTTLYTIIGMQNARQNQEQLHLAIPNISLGIRIGLLLSWPALQLETLVSGRGIGFFVWSAFNSGSSIDANLGLFAMVILAFLLDQLIDISGIFLSRAFNFSRSTP